MWSRRFAFFCLSLLALASAPLRALATEDDDLIAGDEDVLPPPQLIQWDGDYYEGKPRDWLVNRSPAVLPPDAVPAPEDTEVTVQR